MEAISFPISREAACCGIYIYLGSTRVGVKSKEQLRSEYLRKYEDSYKSGLERRRKKLLSQMASSKNAPKPASSSNVVSASSFLSMIGSIPKASKKDAIVIENDDCLQYMAEWVKPVVDNIIKESKEPVEWVVKGTELFSIVVEKPVDTVQNSTSEDTLFDESSEVWSEDVSEEAWVGNSEGVVEPETDDTWSEGDLVWNDEPEENTIWEEPEDVVEEKGTGVDWASDSIWDDNATEDIWWSSEDEKPKKEPIVEPKCTRKHPFESHKTSVDSIENSPKMGISYRESKRFEDRNPNTRHESPKMGTPKESSSVNRTQFKSFSEVKNVEPTPVVKPTITRLDENAIRDFVKSHKLCSEEDILSAFGNHDRVKVKSFIKSALRKYKIFEKHGKFTV